VEFRDGPAAVYGDETPRVVPDATRSGHYSTEWEGRGSRMIRESEDLPEAWRHLPRTWVDVAT
jgi:hypothetical protein